VIIPARSGKVATGHVNLGDNMRTCRKCKTVKVVESRKYCNSCKIQPQTCVCGAIFKSKNHKLCKLCRMTSGNSGICYSCGKTRHIYYSSEMCTSCYRKSVKYKITKEKLKELREIKNCQLCGINLLDEHPHIDHCHTTDRIRGVLCGKCNVIEGMFRDEDHLSAFCDNYKHYLQGDATHGTNKTVE
jgi:hypothetical protein